ncbi:protein kinase domain containing protein, partial [Entamoeba invadens IP1]|uniref:protein kinase domain containing protein n=1 Tax=Entamoeba invadens IP1 TaxID=370355 RepID=UPI0002C3DBF4
MSVNTTQSYFQRKKPGFFERRQAKTEARSAPGQMSERTQTTTDFDSFRSDEPQEQKTPDDKHIAPHFHISKLTLDDVPLVLENTFRFIEKATTTHKALKPFSLMTNEDVVEWVKKIGADRLTLYVIGKHVGQEIRYFDEIKLKKIGIQNEKITEIAQIIQKYKAKSTLGKKILKMKMKTDKALRKMFELQRGYDINNVKPFTDTTKDEQHLICFMTIRNYFAMNSPLITEDKALELFAIVEKFQHDEALFLSEIRKFIYNTHNGVVFQRTLKFAYKMVSDQNSCYYYYKELFLNTVFGFICPSKNVNITKMFFLVQLEPKLSNKIQQPKTNRLLEASRLYAGEVVNEVVDHVKLPIYMIPTQYKLNNENIKTWEDGRLYLTNYRLMWIVSNEIINPVGMGHCMFFDQVPLKMIYDVRVVKGGGKQPIFCLKIISKDHRILHFSLPENQIKNFKELVCIMTSRVDESGFYVDDCEHFCLENIFEGVWQRTAKRIGIDMSGTNPLYVFQSSYKNKKLSGREAIVIRGFPMITEVPERIEDIELAPLLIHRELKSGAFLFRLQYIMNDKGDSILSCSSNLKPTFDTFMVREFLFKTETSLSKQSCLKTQEEANAIQKELLDALQTCDDDQCKRLQDVVDRFVGYQEGLMRSTKNIILELRSGRSILITSYNRNASEIGVITSLVLVLTNKYYRSFGGFIEVIYKEFVELGYFSTVNKKRVFPMHFVAFLMIVDSYMYLFPKQFGFNTKLIEFLYKHCNSGRFRVFVDAKSCGLFHYLYLHKDIFGKEQFLGEDFDFLVPNVAPVQLFPSPKFFFEWMNYTSKHSGLFNSSAAENFDLHDQQTLTEIPPYVKDVFKAKMVDLSNNPLRLVPECLQTFPVLEKLVLSNCQVNYFPYDFFSPMTTLTYFDVSRNGTTNAPFFMPELKTLTNLKYLDISSQEMDMPRFRKFEYPIGLKTVVMRNLKNCLQTSLVKLTNLRMLDISENKFASFSILRQLTTLKELKLESCDQKMIPNELENLKLLTQLNVGKNKLSTLPEWLYELTSLKELKINSNNFVFISKNQTKLTKLRVFDVSNNTDLRYLPVIHPVITKDKIRCCPPPLVTRMHILSNESGVGVLEECFKNWMPLSWSSGDVILVSSENDIFDLPSSKLTKNTRFFMPIFHTNKCPLPLDFAVNDCYVISITSKQWDFVYFWQYYLKLLVPGKTRIYVCLIHEGKAEETLEAKMKDAFPESSFIVLQKSKEFKDQKVIVEKFCEWIGTFRHRWLNEDEDL